MTVQETFKKAKCLRNFQQSEVIIKQKNKAVLKVSLKIIF